MQRSRRSLVLSLWLTATGFCIIEQCGVISGTACTASATVRAAMHQNNPVGLARSMAMSHRQYLAADAPEGMPDEDHLPFGISTGVPSMSEMRAGAFASTMESIGYLGRLSNETFGSRKGRILSESDHQVLEEELALLLNQSEALQRQLSSHLIRQRKLASLTVVEENEPGSLLLPLQAVARTAAEEIQGLRRVGSSDIEPRSEDPILVPERDARDDVLATKSIALLDATASVLHEALRTLECTRALRGSPHACSQNGGLAVSSVECVTQAIQADALACKHPMLATMVEQCASMADRGANALPQPCSSQKLASSADAISISGEHNTCLAAGGRSGVRKCRPRTRCRAQHDLTNVGRKLRGSASACGAARENDLDEDESEHEVPRRNFVNTNLDMCQPRVLVSVKSLRGGGSRTAGKTTCWTTGLGYQVSQDMRAGDADGRCGRLFWASPPRRLCWEPSRPEASTRGWASLRLCGGQQVEDVDIADQGTRSIFGQLGTRIGSREERACARH